MNPNHQLVVTSLKMLNKHVTNMGIYLSLQCQYNLVQFGLTRYLENFYKNNCVM